ncbi:hypothetical protein K440DRAFT_665273 [Wilcoxina mikolae CBS 423.85]|nr:hypothetical protein K440DRAFT_665273 [Wilcoxina mikolae CBS 423.85]
MSATPQLVRSRASPQSVSEISLDHNQYVEVHHPGYGTNTTILRLHAYDPLPPSQPNTIATPNPTPASNILVLPLRQPVRRPPTAGVHYATVLAACLVVACNKPGHLREAGKQIELDNDAVLPAGKYWYHLNDPDAEAKYPICPSFSEWLFDETMIPLPWITASPDPQDDPTIVSRNYGESQMKEAVSARDVSCLITGFGDYLENAHIIPRSELGWFVANSMITFNGYLQYPKNLRAQIDDPCNGFLCRPDMHAAMDAGVFCVVCKEGRFVVHFFDRSKDLGRLYHNVEFHLNTDARVQFMWARFAWTVLRCAAVFSGIRGRKIQLSSGVIADAGDGQLELSQQEMEKFAPDRPGSPKKRKAAGGGAQDNDATSEASSEHASSKPTEASDFSSDKDPDQESFEDEYGNYYCFRFPPDDPEPTPLSDPPTPPQEDLEAMRIRYPQLVRQGESEWSNNYFWQHAPWYPGIQRVEKLKAWLRRKERERITKAAKPPAASPAKRKRVED